MDWTKIDGYSDLPTSVKLFLELPAYGTPELDTAEQALTTAATAAQIGGVALIIAQSKLFIEIERAMQTALKSNMGSDELIRFQAAAMAAAIHSYVTSASYITPAGIPAPIT